MASKLTAYQKRNLAEVCAIGSESLRKVADGLEAQGLLLAKTRIEEVINEIVGDGQGSELSSFLFGLIVGVRQDETAVERMLTTISEFVSSSNAEDVRYEAWPSCRPEIVRLLGSQSIRLATKALEVSYDFERIFMNARFLTSIRPVFDEDRENIMGAAIVQTLRLDYFAAAGGEITLSIAMDRADIERLRMSCDQALRKAQAAYHKTASEWGLPTIMSGGGETTQ